MTSSNISDNWYFDSGCSRHITYKRENLLGYKQTKKGFVTFGDGEKGRVIGVGTLVTTGLPNL